MNHSSVTVHAWQRRNNFRSAFAASGALSFPAFLLMASVGVLLVSGAFAPADALVRQAPMRFEALQPPPSLNDDVALARALEGHLRDSALSSGRWQPESSDPTPADAVDKEPLITIAVEPAIAQPAADKESNAALMEADTPRSMGAETTAQASIRVPEIAPQVDVKSARLLKRPVVHDLRLTKHQARKALQTQTAQRAYQLLMSQLDRGVEDTEFLGLLAVSALALRKADEAHLIYQRLVVLEPDNDQWWTGLAIAREQLGLSAVADYERALALGSGETPAAQLAKTRLQGTG